MVEAERGAGGCTIRRGKRAGFGTHSNDFEGEGGQQQQEEEESEENAYLLEELEQPMEQRLPDTPGVSRDFWQMFLVCFLFPVSHTMSFYSTRFRLAHRSWELCLGARA